jgi:hypothetical protein
MIAALMSPACSAERPSPFANRSASDLPEFQNGGPCRPVVSADLPSGAGCVSVTEGDADGDGSPDSLTVYAHVNEDRRPRSWHLRLDVSTGVVSQRLDAGNPFSYPRAVGAADVDGDGSDEWFVKTLDLAGHGAPWQQLSLFVFGGGSLEEVTFEGRPLAVRVGGISRLGEGAECRDSGLVLLRAEAQNVRNTRWRTSARFLRLEGSSTKQLGRREGRLTISDYNDPDLNRFYDVNCSGLHYST